MDSGVDKLKRWRLWQFSLSTILLATVIVGLMVAWQIDRTKLKRIETQGRRLQREAAVYRNLEAVYKSQVYDLECLLETSVTEESHTPPHLPRELPPRPDDMD